MNRLLSIFIPLFILSASFYSCEEGTDVGKILNDVNDFLGTDLTDDEISNGLKTALEVGTDSAATNLSVKNGYYLDKFVKIPLPPEAEQIRTIINDNNLNNIIDLDSEFEDVVQSVNRAAEESAKEAAPIFKDAITDMSISDAFTILNGKNPAQPTKSSDFDSTAATHYFKVKTKSSLTDLYAPKINTALGKDLGLGFSATQAWTSLSSTYNNYLGDGSVQLALSLAGINLPQSINTDIGEYSTEKALDGLYHKVSDQEKEIRRDPFQWLTDATKEVGEILVKVFGNE